MLFLGLSSHSTIWSFGKVESICPSPVNVNALILLIPFWLSIIENSWVTFYCVGSHVSKNVCPVVKFARPTCKICFGPSCFTNLSFSAWTWTVNKSPTLGWSVIAMPLTHPSMVTLRFCWPFVPVRRAVKSQTELKSYSEFTMKGASASVVP